MKVQNIIEVLKLLAEIIISVTTIIGVPLGVHRFLKRKKEKMLEEAEEKKKSADREDRQDADIQRMKEENCLIMYGLSACLDGLLQLNCNHTVPIAKEKIDKYLNVQAHK